MSFKVLITGSRGFLGSFLSSRLSAEGYQVLSFEANILDERAVQAEILDKKPDCVFHFAGISKPKECDKNRDLAYNINVLGTELLVNAVQRLNKKILLFFASTAQVYQGPSEEEIRKGLIIYENRQCQPQNFYAETKKKAEDILQQASGANLMCCIMRIFNITHRQQDPYFVLPYLYQQIQLYKRDETKDHVHVGNLEVYRDFSLVSNFTDQIAALLKTYSKYQQKYDIFNICSGRARKIADLAAEMKFQMKGEGIKFVVDTNKLRKNDPISICGSNDKIQSLIGEKIENISDSLFIKSFIEH